MQKTINYIQKLRIKYVQTDEEEEIMSQLVYFLEEAQEMLLDEWCEKTIMRELECMI